MDDIGGNGCTDGYVCGQRLARDCGPIEFGAEDSTVGEGVEDQVEAAEEGVGREVCSSGDGADEHGAVWKVCGEGGFEGKEMKLWNNKVQLMDVPRLFTIVYCRPFLAYLECEYPCI